MTDHTENTWFEAVAQSKQLHIDGRFIKLPTFPDEQLQINTTGQAGKGTLQIGFLFYKSVIDTLASWGTPLHNKDRLLDFGVGWGRICRFFLRELPLDSIYGIDVNADLIDICQETFKTNNFTVCPPFPPCDLPASSFTLITGYSVFSHLSESACRAWMEEFHRILVPGGIVAVTTRGREFFDFCHHLKETQPQGYLKALSEMFDDFDEAKHRYDLGEFVHSNHPGISGGGVLTEEYYGESFIPESYARTAYHDLFTFEKFLYKPYVNEHPIMFFKKRMYPNDDTTKELI